MTETQPNGQPTKRQELKPSAEIEEDKKPIKPPATKQITQRRRYPPRAPGFLPVPVDIVIAMSLQLALVITNFFVIFTTFAYDGDDLGWIVFAEIIFTYGGFAYFVGRISHQILVYKKFFQSLNDWHDRKLADITDGESSCCCLWLILLKLAWWIAALLLFPFIIGWSVVQSYKWYQDRRRNAESAVDLTKLENVSGSVADSRQYWKMTDRAYSIWHLGVLSKQASMVVMFVQDFPLLIISFFITNYLGIIVYCISVCVKLIFWMKHMYDLGRLTFFYNPQHYLDHFGIKSITWSNEYGCNIILATFYDEFEHEMSTLQVGDWVGVYDEKKEDWDIMIVWKNRHFKKTDNLVLIDFMEVAKEAIDDFDQGITKNIIVPPQSVHAVNRWDGNIELLRDEDYVKYHDNGQNDVVNDNDAGDMIEESTETVMITKNENNGTQVENGAVDEKSVDLNNEAKENNDDVNKDTEVVNINNNTEVVDDGIDEGGDVVINVAVNDEKTTNKETEVVDNEKRDDGGSMEKNYEMKEREVQSNDEPEDDVENDEENKDKDVKEYQVVSLTNNVEANINVDNDDV